MKKNAGDTEKLKKPAKIALVVSLYNREITEKLEKSCRAELLKAGAKTVTVAHAPGAFELPYLCQRMIETEKPDAVIALGCIIKGQTPHFDFIAQAVTHGIMEISLKHRLPVLFGVLTVNTAAQARDRIAGGKRGDKGVEAAQAAIVILNSQKS